MRTSCLSAVQTMSWFQVSIWQRQVCCPFEETRQDVRELRVIVDERKREGVAGHGFNGGLTEVLVTAGGIHSSIYFNIIHQQHAV